MFSASKLSDDQKSALHAWAAEGASIADLQKRLKDQFGIAITYMDARFMVLDLGIELQDAPKESAAVIPEVVPAKPVPTGVVEVTMDSLALPGALISGKVSFSDGETAIWMLDQYGRPGLDPDTVGYRPSPEDIADFQKQLSELVRAKGI
ncbi:MAG: hypothetical protein EAZ84_09725 [Verrucomicrobia bacterium]|nr:MAG: hypothetical protein EAZ84_09725 [Verrucomicrobiota bacterium]TAE86767.1 MAG: hypothetical protein EAZ82_10080 [Verrucomicrobiota bacterium]TAF24514.1 MAG: hypothetical protein EAZ71_10400 [Verrucomicrobiota bacterium]